MKIWHISDTHGMHDQLSVPEGIDMVICTGDISNYKGLAKNGIETVDFIIWFEKLPIKHKVLIPGNHDGLIESYYIADECEAFRTLLKGITLLIHQSIEIEGIKIFGSPYTPTFFDWSFMKPREALSAYWTDIPEGTDILATHGPPMLILDKVDQYSCHQSVGDVHLLDAVDRIRPRYHLFGHLHNNGSVKNEGQYKSEHTTFINSSCVTDGEFHKGLTSNGTIFEI